MSSGLIPREPVSLETPRVVASVDANNQTSVVGNTTSFSKHSESSVQVGHEGTSVSISNAYHALEGSEKPHRISHDFRVISNQRHLKRERLMKRVRREKELAKDWQHYVDQADVLDKTERIKALLDELSSVQNIPMSSKAVKHVERSIMLYFSLVKAVDMGQAIAIIALYLEAFFEKSMCETVLDQVMKLSVDDQAGDKPDWLKLLKTASNNWKMVVANEGFGHLSKVLSIMLGLGLCSNADLDFTIAGMKLFSIQAMKKQVCAFDLGDAIFSTLVYFVEGGYECFKQGSLNPLIHGDFDFVALENKVARCEELFDYALTGDLRAKEGMDPNDYDSLLREAVEELDVQIKITKNVTTERIMRDKRDKLRKMRVAFDQKRVQGGLREAPYGMGFVGDSGVGKSSVSNIMMVTVLKHCGYSAADDRLITLNESDKYESTYRSDINGVFIDDLGNTKADFVEKAPTQKMLELHNNVRSYANMAEAELKGKVSKEPKVVNTTRNVFMKHATDYSNKPLSILRREDFTCIVRNRPEFQTLGRLDQHKVLEKFPNAIIPDCWELDLYEFEELAANSSNFDTLGTVTSKPIVYKGKEMLGISIFELINFACERAAAHFISQQKLVEKQTDMAKKLPWCDKCRLPCECCSCTEDQFGNLIYPIVQSYVAKKVTRVTGFGELWMNYFECESSELVIEALDWFEYSPWSCWTNYVPAKCLENEFLSDFIMMCNSNELKTRLRSMYIALIAMLLFAVFMTLTVHSVFIIVVFYLLAKIANVVEVQKELLYRHICEKNNSMPEVFRKHRDSMVNYVTWGCISLSFLYLLAKTWKLVRVMHEDHGNLLPTSFTDIQERDEEAQLEDKISEEMNWSTVSVSPIPCHKAVTTMTTDQALSCVRKNLGQLRVEKENKVLGCDIFFLESNLALIPTHMWVEDEMQATISVGGDGKILNFNSWLSKAASVQIPETDFSLVYVPAGGTWKNLVHMLPLDKFRDCPGVLQCAVRDDVGYMRTLKSNVYLRNGKVQNGSRRFYGSKYETSFHTFVGMCMAPIVTDTHQSVIAGFHLGGITGTPKAVCGLLTAKQYMDSRAKLAEIPGVSIVASQGTMKTELYDVKYLLNDQIHEKSPLNKLPKGANLRAYGSCTGRASYYSDVTKLPICETVEEVCGVENNYGAPKFHLGKAWQASLEVSSQPSVGVEGKYLVPAVVDYVKPIIARIETIPELRSYIRPLTEMETVCGIDGLRFIDKLKSSTAIGYPLSGPKAKWIEELSAEDHPDFACPQRLDEQFWDEERRMEREYLAGRRCYFIFKACLKDEPTKVTKDKVRVFQASSAAAQLIIRKYFLPIVRLLSLFPLEAECGVGINSMGPEYSALVEHMHKFGKDRILAGDYSKYDLRMPAQLTLAAFDVLIQIAKHFGYSQDDLTIMRGVATDVCYPVTAFNGDLIELIGSNPSGQNLTVYINSIVNSLLLRSAYLCIYEGQDVPPFRDVAAMMTYGDDVKGSVRNGYDEFNHIAYADFLKERDIVFTMPDKESTPTPFMNDDEADFLKRHVRWSEELQLWQGPLSEDSIFKSLMVVLKSKAVTTKEQSMQNIDGALREWFNYGREHYEMRREQMREIATREGINQGCDMLDKSYDDCLTNFRRRYHWQEALIEDQAGELDFPIDLKRGVRHAYRKRNHIKTICIYLLYYFVNFYILYWSIVMLTEIAAMVKR
nr:hypothetical protein 1 [Mute swan feces associated picorna-like virus 29]